jgi:ribosomal protein S18 acetylase RimI-like enzyme
MKIIAFTADQRKFQNKFLEFPFKVYKNTSQWVPPLNSDIRKIFSKKQHGFYKHGTAIFLLALDEQDRVSGRLAVLENDGYNQHFNSRTASFYMFECVEDFYVANALFNSGIDWAKSRGLSEMIGPKGFSVFDGFGTLIKGFEYRATFGQIYNPPYYQEFLEKLGFEKKWDTFTGYMDRTFHLPEKIFQVAALVKQKRGFEIKEFNKKNEMKYYVNALKDLYNASLAYDSRNMPISDADMQTMVKQVMKFADPHLIKFILKEGKPVGFLMAFPDIARALIRCKGKLLPFGWYQILRELKITDTVDMHGAGILPEYQRIGGNALLYAEIAKSVTSKPNYQYAEFLQVRDNNTQMLLEWENMGVEVRKTHRYYTKSLL